MRKISEFVSLVSLEINQLNHFNAWLCTSSIGKVNVWTRKVLKRNSHPIEDLANIH